jgi:transcriptional regulator with XRE-family HTH domain
MKQLATKIRKLREIYGFSQESVAFELGISQAAYSKKESGRTELSLSCLEKLAKIYQLSITDIIGLSTQELLMLVIQKNKKVSM